MGDFTFVEGLLKEFSGNGNPGCSCEVYRRGELIFSGCFGYSDIERAKPLRTDDIFRIYSMSKVITCVAALKLYERGLFLLNDPLAEYLPEFASPRAFRRSPAGALSISAAASPIRVKDLFTMTSGLTYPGTQMETERQTAAVMDRLGKEEEAGRPFDVRCLSKALAEVPLAFDPGSHWCYGFSHDVLGALIEVLSGKRLGLFLEEEVFAPLGMADTSFRIPEEKRDRLCPLYRPSVDGSLTKSEGDDARFAPDAKMESGGAGLLSTLGDYGRFARMLVRGGELDGERILGRKTIGLMAADHLGPSHRADFDWPQMAGYGYGLGVRVMVDPQAGGCNGSVGEFGWGGLAGTWVLVDPREELSVVYMQQMIPSLESYRHPRLRAAIYGAI